MFSSTDLKQKEIKDTLDIDQLDNDFLPTCLIKSVLVSFGDQNIAILFLPPGYLRAKFNEMTKWATISTNL